MCLPAAYVRRHDWCSDLLLHAALREALDEGLGSKLVQAFLAVHKSELEWTKSMKEDSSSTDDYIARMAAELYDRY